MSDTRNTTGSNEVSDIIYLSGIDNEAARQAADGDLYGKLGLLIGPDTGGTKRAKADYLPSIPFYARWAADNGCFSRGGDFDQAEWLGMLERAVETIDGAHDSCLFAVAPDVFNPAEMKGDPIATIERSLPVLPKIRELGIPAALVLQDGLEDCTELIPWDAFDVAFVGGSDDFKLGYCDFRKQGNPHYHADPFVGGAVSEKTEQWARLIWSCYEHGKEIHVGRVNSQIRLAFSQAIGAASADGTFLGRAGATQGLERIRRWFDVLDDVEPTPVILDGPKAQQTFSWAA